MSRTKVEGPVDENSDGPNTMRSFCRALPKVELHAHLNGSLSADTLKKLYQLQHSDDVEGSKIMDVEKITSLAEYGHIPIKISDPMSSNPYRSSFKGASFNSGDFENKLQEFSRCFELFSIAHSLTDTPRAVFLATCDVIREFFEDNVIYLELRSTPRAVGGKMTKREYVEAIINAINDAARENVELAMSLVKEHASRLVGIDLSGDPLKGEAFLHVLEDSKKAGLRIAAHCAEIPNEVEVLDILGFAPNRLGHCTCVHPSLGGSDRLFARLLESRIPVELCLTSNIKSGTVPTYKSHQFKYLYEAGHPLCVATDDKGVFDTTLSEELELVAIHFGLGKEELKSISKKAVAYSFASDEEKNKLIGIINDFSWDL